MRKKTSLAENLPIIKESGYQYLSRQNDTILFFGIGVHFYPSVNKWTVGTKVHYGNAVAFLKFFRELTGNKGKAVL